MKKITFFANLRIYQSKDTFENVDYIEGGHKGMDTPPYTCCLYKPLRFWLKEGVKKSYGRVKISIAHAPVTDKQTP